MKPAFDQTNSKNSLVDDFETQVLSQIDTISQLRQDFIKSGVPMSDFNTDTLVQINYDFLREQQTQEHHKKMLDLNKSIRMSSQKKELMKLKAIASINEQRKKLKMKAKMDSILIPSNLTKSETESRPISQHKRTLTSRQHILRG